jgi:iron complex transport system ATP-binding protein
LQAKSSQIIALIGANGTGKSTLLRTLAGLQPALDGKIWLNSKDFNKLTPKEIAFQVSLVLTDRIQTGYLTVGDLVAMGRHPHTDWKGRMAKGDVKAVLDALKITGLSNLIHSDLQELSDGQKQKTMIARAMAQDGDLMLLDEPLIHLDVPSKWEIMNLLRCMAHERSKTVILATHELDLSLRMADQLWLIDEKENLIAGAPEDLVLDGLISKVFDSQQYFFDQDLGGFAMKSEGIKVKVVGSGSILIWTKRALERAGYQAVDHGGGLEVVCKDSGSSRLWSVKMGEVSMTCNSIGELIDSLNKIHNHS